MSDTKLFKPPVVPKTGDFIMTSSSYHIQFSGRVCSVFHNQDGTLFVLVEPQGMRGVFQAVPPEALLRVTHLPNETVLERYTAPSE